MYKNAEFCADQIRRDKWISQVATYWKYKVGFKGITLFFNVNFDLVAVMINYSPR